MNNLHWENLLVHFRRMEQSRHEASVFPSIDLNRRQLGDLELLLNRAFYPLSGYMGRRDCESVLESMRLSDPGGLVEDERMEGGAPEARFHR